MEIKDVEYNDYVYCVEVPKYHTLLVRRNGKICWSGNCRTVTAPYYDKIEGDTNLRASRTEDDDYKLVDVKDYQGWYDRYIEKPHHILHANDEGNFDYKNKVNEYHWLFKIDKVDYNSVREVFSQYEAEMADLSYETAIVVRADGNVYGVIGGKNFVNSQVVGDLTGAYITHNHPIGETEFSFSFEDVNSFINNKLTYLKGLDQEYEYELSWDLFESDPQPPENLMTFENTQNFRIYEYTKKYNIRYRRFKKTYE